MDNNGFDAEILQDFLTESGELLEQLEGDLVVLESSPQDLDLLNQIFRALHTIKGSASFLALTNLVEIAHSSEGTLNAARNSQIVVDQHAMDLLLQSVDVLKVQFGQLTNGEPLDKADQLLIDELVKLGEGIQDGAKKTEDAPADGPAAAHESDTAATTTSPSGCPNVQPLELDGPQADLFEFLVADVHESTDQLASQLALASELSTMSQGCEQLCDTAESLTKALEFFEFGAMSELSALLVKASEVIPDLDEDSRTLLFVRLDAMLLVIQNQAEGLSAGEMRTWATGPLVDQITALDTGEEFAESALGAAATEPTAFLHAIGVYLDGYEEAPAQGESCATGICEAVPVPGDTQQRQQTSSMAGSTATDSPSTVAPSGATAQAEKPAVAQEAKASVRAPTAAVEQTIRVDVSRLETLMNLVGELVLQKNRISALSRQIASSADQETAETMGIVADSLDRVTGDIQNSVMRTRLQPLDKIFGKYPRLIRDLSRKTGKNINLVIEGGDTEVDKSVIDKLADPLVHLLRNSADHGIEMPEDRVSAGKSDTGTITLAASHEGSYVQLIVRDDGKGLSRDVLLRKAIERELLTEEQAEQMSDKDVYQLIFHPGFSTTEQVSDLSGRGVGMDVVRSNIALIKGTIDLNSTPGLGTVLTIKIPLTIAIMPAMMVAVQHETYAIPLGNILEIVRPTKDQLTTIREHPVLRLRDEMLPLFNAEDVLGLAPGTEAPQYAVVLSLGDRCLGLMVTRPIGQQEIVIKSLDENANTENSSVSGATVRDDGGVSLIVDVAGLFQMATETVGSDQLERKEGQCVGAGAA